MPERAFRSGLVLGELRPGKMVKLCRLLQLTAVRAFPQRSSLNVADGADFPPLRIHEMIKPDYHRRNLLLLAKT